MFNYVRLFSGCRHEHLHALKHYIYKCIDMDLMIKPMRRPIFKIAGWKKYAAFAVAVVMLFANVIMPSRYYIEVNFVCILALIAFFVPMIPQAFRQGCRQYAYTLIALVSVMAVPLIGTLLLYLHNANLV